MRIITFFTPGYSRAAQVWRIFAAIHYPSTHITAYTPNELPQHLRAYCESNIRGYGFWRWKPFLILNELSQMSEGEALWYLDVGTLLLNSTLPRLEYDYYFQLSFFHDVRMWCSSSLNLLPSANEFFRHGLMADASVIGIRHSPESVKLVNEWYDLCCNHLLLGDNIGANADPPFIDHRHDQSLLSYLIYMNSLRLNMPLTQFSGKIAPVILHHRLSNSSNPFAIGKYIAFFLIYKFLYWPFRSSETVVSPLPTLGASVIQSILKSLLSTK